jgi:hypothetical protein
MSSVILDNNNIDFANLRLGSVRKAVKLLYKKDPLLIKTPKLYSPFGAKVNKWKTYSGFDEYYMECCVSADQGEEDTAFRTMVSDIQATVCDLIKENSGSLFKDFTGDSPNFTPVFKEQEPYKPNMKITLPRNSNGEFMCDFFDADKNAVALNDGNIQELLSKGCAFRAILEFDRVWYFNDKFGVTIKLKQLKFSKAPTKTETTPSSTAPVPDNYCILDEDSE